MICHSTKKSQANKKGRNKIDKKTCTTIFETFSGKLDESTKEITSTTNPKNGRHTEKEIYKLGDCSNRYSAVFVAPYTSICIKK